MFKSNNSCPLARLAKKPVIFSVQGVIVVVERHALQRGELYRNQHAPTAAGTVPELPRRVDLPGTIQGPNMLTHGALNIAGGLSIVLIIGAQGCNVFFQVGSQATFGSITTNTGASISGRLFARDIGCQCEDGPSVLVVSLKKSTLSKVAQTINTQS